MLNRSTSNSDAFELACSALELHADSIPTRLKKRDRWVLWRLEKSERQDDKPRKMMRQANGRAAKSNDPATWTGFDKALSVYQSSRRAKSVSRIPFSGIGFVFAADDDIIGVDLDNCRNSETGELESWAEQVLKRFDTYTEVSPSGKGIKLFCRGRLPIDSTGRKVKFSGGAVEAYQHGRYFSVTGHKLDDAPKIVAKAQKAIDWLWGKFFCKSGDEAQAMQNDRGENRVQDRSEVLERARKYLAKMPAAVSGNRGHDATFHVACKLVLGFDLSPSEAFPLMLEYSGRCKPPWTEVEIRHKLEDADKQPGERGKLLVKQRAASPENQATEIAELAANWDLWHTPSGDAYATIPVGSHREHWPVRSKSFKGRLSKEYYDTVGKAANPQALAAGLNLLEARALYDGEEHDVAVRVAKKGRNIYIDLCDAEWRAVKITRRGWIVVDNPPVRFRRSKSMLPLPIPKEGGSVEDLRPFVNVTDADWPLVVAWLATALQPQGPYPVLALFALQGSGKSNTARFLRALIDPNAAPLRAESREIRDLMLSANSNWCLAFDNLSHLPFWLSDALCRLSTGGGFATRVLYTDADEIVFDAMRPMILTSIVELAERSDLLDRCLPVTLPTIDEDRRCDERTLLEKFEAARPKILGALCDVVAGALAHLPEVQLSKLPRMADFAKWATAAEKALDWEPGTFMAAYKRNRANANKLALEASPISSKLLDLLGNQGDWKGTAAELLEELDRMFGEDYKRPPAWPKGPRALSHHLRRLAPNLIADGWSIDFRTGRERTISITAVDSRNIAPFASKPSKGRKKRRSYRDSGGD